MIKLERLADAKDLLDQAKSKGIRGADFDQLEQRLNGAIKALAIKPDMLTPTTTWASTSKAKQAGRGDRGLQQSAIHQA